jgi:TRAP-type C4-dicarboxylate transport system permease large subunit
MKAFVLAAVAVIAFASLSGSAVSQPATSGAAPSEALSKRDFRAQRR